MVCSEDDMKRLLDALSRDIPFINVGHRRALIEHVERHGLHGEWWLTPFVSVHLDSLRVMSDG